MTQLRLPALLAAISIASGAMAATTTTVVDIPAADGGTQRYLHVRPDAPIATIVHLPGGSGVFSFGSDGSSSTGVGQCNPVLRTQAAYAARGIAVALVDATSNGSIRNYDNVLAVIRHVRARDNVPVWIMGGSDSTAATAFAAVQLPADIPAGAIFFAPQRPTATVPSILRPTLVTYHSGDTGQFGNQFFNALTSATVRERSVITGGSDVGCGYHLFNGSEAAFADTTASFIERHNGATGASSALNFQGLWYRGEAESGWGVNVAHQGDILFVTWFTYDTDGTQMWLVGDNVRRTTGNNYTGTLYRTTGPAFNAVPFNPSQVGVTTVGTVTLGFSDANNGSFIYTVNGVSQSKPVVRQIFSATVPTCAAGTTPSATNFQDLWYRSPAESEAGWGVNVTHQGDILFVTWFTYDATGRGMWVVGDRVERTSGNTFTGPLYRTTGPAFSAVPWLPSGLGVTQVGSATFTFTGNNAGTFTYTVNGITQTKNITRQVFGSPVTVCR